MSTKKPTNTGAYLEGKQVKPLVVKSAPYTSPGEHEILVKNYAVAINPIDWFKQFIGNVLFGHIKYPFILGEDLACEVVEVGKCVTRFHVGDRVLAHALGFNEDRNRSSEGAYQQ
jgi:NADPH:quinone reductase-like Zn-dependent oxidoreductase